MVRLYSITARTEYYNMFNQSAEGYLTASIRLEHRPTEEEAKELFADYFKGCIRGEITELTVDEW